MPKFTAKVVDGMRGPGTNPDPSPDGPQGQLPSYMRAKSSGDRNAPKPVVFVSRYPGHILQITSPGDGIDPATGRTTTARCVAARFRNNEYRLDPTASNFKLLYEALTSHPRFGIGRDFWLRDEAIKLGEEARYNQMKTQLKANPEELARLLGDLKGEEFPVSQPEASKAEAPAN